MKKYPFTPDGIAGLEKDFRLLTPAALEKELEGITDDFSNWLKRHFHFNQCQLSLLDTIRPAFPYFPDNLPSDQ